MFAERGWGTNCVRLETEGCSLLAIVADPAGPLAFGTGYLLSIMVVPQPGQQGATAAERLRNTDGRGWFQDVLLKGIPETQEILKMEMVIRQSPLRTVTTVPLFCAAARAAGSQTEDGVPGRRCPDPRARRRGEGGDEPGPPTGGTGGGKLGCGSGSEVGG